MSDERLYVPYYRSPKHVISTLEGANFSNLFRLRSSQRVRSRDIAITIDGACPGNGTPYARAAMGVYFGPDSQHNMAELLWYGRQTNQRAELHAAILALRKVRELVRGGYLRTGTVVLVSDSQYVVRCMTEWVYKWRYNGWENAKFLPVVNKEDIQELDDLINELWDLRGIQVKFWGVRRRYIKEADKLAKERLEY